MNDTLRAVLVLILLVALVVIPNIKTVSQKQAMVIERFGKFHRIIDKPGIYILIPLYERAVQSVSLDPIKHQLNLKDQVKLDYIYQITDVEAFVYHAIDSIHAFHEELINLSIHENYDGLLSQMSEIASHYGMNILESNINN